VGCISVTGKRFVGLRESIAFRATEIRSFMSVDIQFAGSTAAAFIPITIGDFAQGLRRRTRQLP
jgi:hypothetical protein